MPSTGLTKRALLTFLAEEKQVHAKDVASAFGVDYAVAAMALLRLVRQGLLSREHAGDRGVYRYQLSERGQARLKYLEDQRGASAG